METAVDAIAPCWSPHQIAVGDNEESTDEGEVTPISMGVLQDEVVYRIPFRDKLQNFGLSEFHCA